jgi:hypothetical protein
MHMKRKGAKPSRVPGERKQGGPRWGIRGTRRGLPMLGGVAAILLTAFACAHFGLFGPRGPRPLTILYSCEAAGELKPCG